MTLQENIMNMRVQQARVRDKTGFHSNNSNEVYGALLIGDGLVLCCDNGDIISVKDVDILEIYPTWVDLSEEIIGD